MVSALSRRRGASARQQSGSRAQTTPVAAALTPSASTLAALVPCGIRALRFAAVETSPNGSPPHGVAVTWLRGTPEKVPKRPTVAGIGREGLHRFSGASSRSTLPWPRPLPLPAAVALKSRRPKALRLGVRPPRRPDEEGRAFRHPSSRTTADALGGVASVAGRGAAHHPRGAARTRGKLTRSRPGPLTSPPAEGQACSYWLPAPGSRGAGRLSSGHS